MLYHCSRRHCLQPTVDESSSDSDSDADDDDYETIYLNCQAIMPHHFDHVVSDANRSTSVRVGPSTGNVGGLVGKPETETAKGRGTIRRNAVEQNKDGVIVVWGSYNPERGEPEPEVHRETDHVTQSASLMLHCCEEVSSMHCVSVCFPNAAVMMVR